MGFEFDIEVHMAMYLHIQRTCDITPYWLAFYVSARRNTPPVFNTESKMFSVAVVYQHKLSNRTVTHILSDN